MKQILLCLILLTPLNANGDELLDILLELQKASSEIRQGFEEVKAGLIESKVALTDSMEQLNALQLILNEQKDDLEEAQKEVDQLRVVMIVGGSVLGAGMVTAIIVAIVK